MDDTISDRASVGANLVFAPAPSSVRTRLRGCDQMPVLARSDRIPGTEFGVFDPRSARDHSLSDRWVRLSRGHPAWRARVPSRGGLLALARGSAEEAQSCTGRHPAVRDCPGAGIVCPGGAPTNSGVRHRVRARPVQGRTASEAIAEQQPTAIGASLAPLGQVRRRIWVARHDLIRGQARWTAPAGYARPRGAPADPSARGSRFAGSDGAGTQRRRPVRDARS